MLATGSDASEEARLAMQAHQRRFGEHLIENGYFDKRIRRLWNQYKDMRLAWPENQWREECVRGSRATGASIDDVHEWRDVRAA